MKRILILNGSPRKNGKTASLIKAFTEGAETSGNEVRNLYISEMDIKGCIACEACSQNGGNCIQKDDMIQVNEAVEWAEVIVFASPMYWGIITGQLKIVIDRLYAECNKLGWKGFNKETALIMTARGDYYQQSLDFYSIFTDMMKWKNWGTVLGAGKEKEAYAIGASIN
ncbi:flavodoxin family protein [Anaerosporobacter sp.]|uniref:flavodoxin family protein n=1 Tax=Anaerosporobacter sp. TaxID=1872529 RepID=UPI00286F54E0|nr:flavodoxin family protein [Anaerosporobacter sp.]